MSNDAVTKEGGRAKRGPVDQLVGDHHVQRVNVFPQAADRADGDDALYAQGLEREDVGPGRYLGRGNSVSTPMPGEERQPYFSKSSQQDAVARITEGRFDSHVLPVREVFHVVQAGPADESRLWVTHGASSTIRRSAVEYGVCATPRSVTIAVTYSWGVTSKAGLMASTPSAAILSPLKSVYLC